MKQLKIKKLGSGLFADVFQHPEFPDIAVKAFDGTKETEYEKYLEWAILHQHNRFVPPIIDWIRSPSHVGFTLNDVVTDIVFFKKLQKASRSQIKNATNELCDLSKVDAGHSSTQELWTLERRAVLIGLTKCDDPDAVEISEFFLRHTDRLDLHAANVMMHDNQLVFTDPLA